MKVIKVFNVVLLWVIYINAYNVYVLSPISWCTSPEGLKIIIIVFNYWSLSSISFLSCVGFICGGIGYILYSYSNNKEKKQMFKKIITYSVIGILFSGLTFALTQQICGFPVV